MPFQVQSNSVNTDTEGAIESIRINGRGVRIKRVEFRGSVSAFFPQGRSKLSLIMRCPHSAGVRKAGFDLACVAGV